MKNAMNILKIMMILKVKLSNSKEKKIHGLSTPPKQARSSGLLNTRKMLTNKFYLMN